VFDNVPETRKMNQTMTFKLLRACRGVTRSVFNQHVLPRLAFSRFARHSAAAFALGYALSEDCQSRFLAKARPDDDFK
jgi:hypothetical protein